MSSSRRAWPSRRAPVGAAPHVGLGGEARLERRRSRCWPWCRRTRTAARGGGRARRVRGVGGRSSRRRHSRRDPSARRDAAGPSASMACGRAGAGAGAAAQADGGVVVDRAVGRDARRHRDGAVGGAALQAPQGGAQGAAPAVLGASRSWFTSKRSLCALAPLGQTAAHLPQPTQSSSWRTISQPRALPPAKAACGRRSRTSRPRRLSGIVTTSAGAAGRRPCGPSRARRRRTWAARRRSW